MIKLINVVKKFGKIEAVKGINLEVEKGSLFAFLGENGAGKSTTLSMICTESEPTSGEIFIDDEKLTFKNRKLFRQKLGVVFQENVLDDLLTVRENLYNRASLYGKTKAEITERLALVSSIMGIEDILNRRFEKLSGGQKRRAEIARAIMHDPEILLLDEPTTGLDPKTRVSVWKIIDYLREELGMTVFLTTHYLEEAKDADQLAVIHKGKIIAQGTPANIRSRFSVDKIFFYDAKVAELQKIMKKMNLPFKVTNRTMRVDVIDENVEILAILNQAIGFYDSFEVIKGNLDDAFISMIKRTPMISRNLKIYFRDRTAVFMSLLTVLIIIGLYAIFLGNNMEEMFKQASGKTIGIQELVNTWVIAGILSITPVTVSLAVFSLKVHDEELSIARSFAITPASRWRIVISYIVSGLVASFLLSVVTLFVGEMYIWLTGGAFLPFESWIRLIGVILINVFCCSSMMFFIASLVKKASAFSSVSTIVGTVIGFIAGIYLPIGSLPATVQTAMKCFPFTYGASTIREIMTKEPLQQVFAGNTQAMDATKEMIGITIYWSDKTVTTGLSLLILSAFAVVFGVLSVILMKRQTK